jgi:hypothetical protein
MPCASDFVVRFTWLVPAALVVCSYGCSGANRANVTGKVVRADGVPLVGATVVARSDETGKSARGITNANGSYELSTVEPGDGVVPGEYSVMVIENRGRPDNMKPPTISDKFADPSRSGLTFSVQAGEDKVFDITVDRS